MKKLILFTILAILVSYQNLLFYISFDFQMIIALIFAPFVLYIQNKEQKSLRFGLFSIGFLVLYPFLKVQSLYFFGFVFFILFLIETNYGKLNNLPIFLLILLSPLASYIFNVFGFPIRLQITELAAQMLSFVYQDISFSGNIILLGKNIYKVAPECMGLNLLTTGLILTLYIIANREKESKKTASFWQTTIILSISLTLIIFSNLIRIIGIVILDAPPETTMHELLGLISLIVYVVLPMYFIVKKVSFFFQTSITSKSPKGDFFIFFHNVKKYISIRFHNVKSCKKAPFRGLGSSRSEIKVPAGILGSSRSEIKASPKGRLPRFELKLSSRGFRGYILGILIILQLGTLNYFRENFRNYTFDESISSIELQGFEKQELEGNILQFRNEKTLIYIKPSAQFYGADHTPMICWKGSGYDFSEEKIITVNEQEIYFSVLKTEAGEKLYTAWWYDNGKHKTISQIDWRWNMMLGSEPYRLINVTCSTKEDLLFQIQYFLDRIKF